jgi:hypothetical protein
MRPVIVAVAVLFSTSVATANGESDRLFEEGVAAFEGGEYAAALDAFEAAYALAPAPDVLLNIGMCQRLVGRPADAVNSLRRYLSAMGTEVSAEESASIQQQVDELIPTLGQVALVVSEPGTRLFIDGQPLGIAPLGWTVAVQPGEHQVEARADGFEPSVESVRVAAGQTVTLTLALPRLTESVTPAPGSPAEGTTDGGGGLGWWFWGSTIAAGTLGVAVAITGGITLKLADDCKPVACPDMETRDTGLALRTTTDVLLGFACAAAVSAILAVVLDETGADSESSAATVTAFASPAGIGIAW